MVSAVLRKPETAAVRIAGVQWFFIALLILVTALLLGLSRHGAYRLLAGGRV